MPAWVIPQATTPPSVVNPQTLAHWFPGHTLAAALQPGEKTNCNLQAEQLQLGTTPTQQAGPPADTGRLCYGCSLRDRVI